MTSKVCLVHYHEIGLKGKNRSTFERQLITNLKRALKGRSAHVERLAGYVRVHFEDGAVPQDVPGLIACVPGVARVSVAFMCERDPEQYNAAAVESLKGCEPFESFKVHGRRSNTDYPIHSIDLNRQVGAVLCDAFPEKNIPAKSAAGVAAHGAEEADLSPKPGGGDSLVIGFAAGFDENAFRAKRLAGGVKMVCGEKYGFAAKADGTDPCCFRLHNRHLTGIGCGGKSGR